MPRTKKSEHVGPIAELRERARSVENDFVTESVSVDKKTYERLVGFIETEGCSLREGIRRAVKLGVEGLTYENRYTDAPNSFSLPPTVDKPGFQVSPIAAPFTDDLYANNDYAVKAPPGIE